ncbi:MAG: translation initiation factor [Polyangiales bacterium]
MAGDNKPRSKSPFAALEGLRDSLPRGAEPKPATLTREAAAAQFEEKVVLSRSKKDRGGKFVTTIAGVRADAREAMARDIRVAVGCGATVEDELIVVQGDQHARLRGFLEARGVRKVIIGA